MANALYPSAKAAMLQGAINLLTADVRAALLKTSVYNATHAFMSDIAANVIARSTSLTGKSVDPATATFDSDDALFASVPSGPDDVAVVVLFIHTGNDATARLLGFFDTGLTGVPLTPDGRDIRVMVDDDEYGVPGWFQL